ncbi:flagellar filament capping protein FliD, partial [Deltaproteobacteria bacterium]|nr:flagellar filament capping protein FliD [Deltaproteobacteria bacterium]
MALSTSMISGLASGFDWRTMIDQLIAIESKPLELIEQKKSVYEEQLSEWQSFNTKLLSLKTTSQGLSDPDDFYLYTSSMTSNDSSVDASDLLSVSTSSSASSGSYLIQINSLATAHKLSSSSFSDFSNALGSDYTGDIIINGTVISITESDGLDDIRNRINNANSGSNPSGVTASIITYSTNDYRLILTSDNTGEDGISLQNGSSSDLLELFGWKDGSSSVKNSITGGAQSDEFSGSTQDIKTLLGLSTTQSGTIEVDGKNISIDFSSDSLETIKTKIDALNNVSASIITNTDNGTTSYRLQIDGTQIFQDEQNILETLGILANGFSDVQGTTSANSMTTNGDTILSTTRLSDIDGYLSWTSGDDISISGDDHSGKNVNESFSIASSSTVQDLLDAIEVAFEAKGDDVSVHVTSEGTIEVEDMETGTSSLTVSLSSSIHDGDLDWGAFSALDTVRSREIVAGQNSSLTVDGINVTSEDNSVEDVLPGVTLNLLKADTDTIVTLNIERDISAIKDKIDSFVTAYNDVASYINQQSSYDEEEETTGGILFGDGTLSSVRSDLSSILVQPIWGVSSEFSILGLVGINLDNEGQLGIDS